MSVLTRIKNNQITDSTILANTKIVPGSIVGSLFNANLTMTSDVTITGNLTVQGSSTYLTVASTNTYVNDPLIVMNNAFTGTNTNDIGLLFNRGSDTNQAIIWDESEDEFRLIATSETGTTYGNVTTSSYANVRVGNINVEYLATIGTLSLVGNIDAVDLTLSGDLAVNGADITTTASTFNLLDATATTLNFAGAATVLTIGATSGTASLRNANIWLPNATSLDGAQTNVNIFTQNALTANVLTSATTADVLTSATTLRLGSTSGVLQLNNPSIQGNGTTQDLFTSNATTVNFATKAETLTIGAVTGTTNIQNNLDVDLTLNARDIQGTVIGNVTTANAYFSDAHVDSLTTGRVVFVGASKAVVDDAELTYNSTYNTLNVGDLTLDGANATIKTTGVDQDLIIDTNGLGNVSISGVRLTDVADPEDVQDAVTLSYLNQQISSAVTNIQLDDTDITITDTGTAPGVITGNVDATQFLEANANAVSFYGTGASSLVNMDNLNSNVRVYSDNFYAAGNAIVGSTYDSTTWNNGALVVAGGIGVAGNVHIQGNLFVANIYNVSEDVLTVKEPLLYLEANVIYPYDYDIGFYSQFTGDVGNLYQHTGMIRDDSDSKWKLFSNVGEPALGQVDFTNARWETLVLGNIEVRTSTGLVTDQTTINVFNATATSLNLGGAATTLTMGAASGTANLRNANIWLPNAVTIDGAQATVNLLGNATTVDAFKGATDLEMGATTGTTYIRNATISFPNATNIHVDQSSVTFANTNATTIEAFGSATTLKVGANSGTLTLRNPTVIGTETTQNLYNTVATTVNFAGAATSVVAGATTGTFNIRNANLYLPNATSIYSGQSTVALLNENVTTLNGFGAATALTLGATSGTASIRNATLSLPYATNIHVSQSSLSFANANATSVQAFGAATELYFAAAGSNTFIRGNTISSGGLVTLASIPATYATNNPAAAETSLYVQGGSVLRGNVFITEEANVHHANVYAETISTSPTTGALVVGGGVGINGNLHIHGGAVVNSDHTVDPFQVKGKYATTLIYADSVTDTVTIGGSNTTPISGATLRVNGTGAMVIPVGTTSERPGTNGNVDVAGMVRVNSSLSILEYYDGAAWQSSQGSFTVITSEQFSGNGVANVFTLGGSSSTASTMVAINGVLQIPTTAYSVSGTELTFTEPPETGDLIDVRRLTTTVTVDELGFGFNIFKANADAAYIATGTSSSEPRLSIDNAGLVTVTGDMLIEGNLTVNGGTSGTVTLGDANTDNVVFGADINSSIIPNTNNTYDLGSSAQRWRKVYSHATVHDQTATNVSASATPTLIDSFSSSTYSSAKYLVQVKDGSSIQSAEVLLVQDTSNAFISTYAVVSNGAGLGTFSANIATGTVKLWYTSTSATNSNVKVHTTYIV